MKELEIRNQKIIDAVIEKAKKLCPESLALIGIYGSFLTGDIHEKSDLDLLIVINDDNGWQLSCQFIQEDLLVGHDIYCTSWESLEYDAKVEHPNIAKLMDSRIVYCADEKYLERLEGLRAQAREKLAGPLTAEDYEIAEKQLKDAEHMLVQALITKDLADKRIMAGEILYYLENAIPQLNKAYYRLGGRRIRQELEAMSRRPENLWDLIQGVTTATSCEELDAALLALVQAVATTFADAKASLPKGELEAPGENLKGTYEEMFSNWRNKMYLAAATQDYHLSYLTLDSLQAMIDDIAGGVAITRENVMTSYNPQDLYATAKHFDAVLERYLQEYEKAGLDVAKYADVDAFLKSYLA